MKILFNCTFILISVFFLSCNGLNHGNFNKRKYTTLKSDETYPKGEPTEAITATPNDEMPDADLTPPETNNDLSNLPDVEEDSELTDGDQPAPQLNEAPHKIRQMKRVFNSIIELEKPKNRPAEPSKFDSPTPETEPISDTELPFFIAWLIYLAVGILAVAALIAGYYFVIQALFFLAGFLTLLALIGGIILFVALTRQSKKGNNSKLMKLMKIATLVEMIIAGSIVIAGLVILIFLLIVLLLFW